MAVGRWRTWLWIGLLLVVAAAAGSAAFVFYSPDRNSAGTLVQTLVTVATAATGAAAWLWTRLQSAGAAQLPLDRAADELAEQLRGQWDQAANERKLTYPAPIPLRWRWSPRQVTSPIREAVGGPRGGRFAPLPGMVAITAEDLQSGGLNDLHGVYSGVDSGRLIILGGPGAGKSGAGIRLLQDALAYRTRVAASDRARIPVPVLITLQGWEPISESMIDWLATRLTRDYALLRAPEYGRDTAVGLLKSGRLAVILDGLDEMPETLRPVALSALNEQATFRLVVLTRSEELSAAVSDTHLRGAAALELLPIDPGQAADYLERCQTDPLPPSWQRLAAHLQEQPTGVVAQALDTPLMLSLVRDNYGRGDRIDELLDGNRFATREAIEDHLLAQVLPTAYDPRPGRPVPPYTVDQAQRWLGQIARRMNEEGTRDLAWWRIPRWVPAWPRVLVTIFVLFVVSALVVTSVVELVDQLHLQVSETGSQIERVAYYGDALISGFILGFWLLFVSTFGGEPSLSRDGLQWSRADTRMILLMGLAVGLVTGIQFTYGYGLWLGLAAEHKFGPVAGLLLGLMSGLVVGLGFALSGGPPRQWGRLRWSRADIRLILLIGLVVGLVAGLGAGIACGLVIAFGGGPSQRWGRLRWSRTTIPTTLLIGLVVGLVVGLVFGFVYQFGLVVGLVVGLLAGLVFALLFGFGQSSTVATSPLDPRSLWQRERQFGVFMGLGFGLAYGLGAGLVEKLMHPTYGIGYWLGYGLAEGPVVGLGIGLVCSATWAVVLASAQLRCRGEAPVRLLRFLDDARTRQVLRTVGPVYQFRHARLQDRLAGMCEEALPVRPPVAPAPGRASSDKDTDLPSVFS